MWSERFRVCVCVCSSVWHTLCLFAVPYRVASVARIEMLWICGDKFVNALLSPFPINIRLEHCNKRYQR